MPKPIAKFRCGTVTAAVFENVYDSNGKVTKSYAVEILRNYTTKSGEFKRMSTYTEADLPKVALVAQKAFEHLTMKAEEEAFPEAQEIE